MGVAVNSVVGVIGVIILLCALLCVLLGALLCVLLGRIRVCITLYLPPSYSLSIRAHSIAASVLKWLKKVTYVKDRFQEAVGGCIVLHAHRSIPFCSCLTSAYTARTDVLG